LAAPILDQSYDINTWGGGGSGSLINENRSLGQSFTVGTSGILSQLDFNIWHISGNNQVQLSLVSLDGSGTPNQSDPILTTLLGDIATGYENNSYYSADISRFNFFVTKEQEYAFYLDVIGTSALAVLGGNHYEDGLTFDGPGYLGGSAWVNEGVLGGSSAGREYTIDLNFRTFVSEVPEPPTVLLMIGLLGLLILKRYSVRPA